MESKIPGGDIIDQMADMFFETTRKWAHYDDEEYSFLSSEFAHEKLLKIDLRYKTDKGRVQVEENFGLN